MSETGSRQESPASASGIREDDDDAVRNDDEGTLQNSEDGAAAASDAEVGDDDEMDRDSDALSEIDEDQFEDYDPEKANIEDRPINIDEDVAKTLKASKRKGGAGTAKKPKEGRREKKRSRDDEATHEDDGETSRPRKSRRSDTDRNDESRASPARVEENLTPEERRRRALERALDAATKAPSKRRKRKDETDLDDPVEEQLSNLVVQMERACESDNNAREAGQPAVHKLKLLPEVSNMLNRNLSQEAVLDPDTQFLRAVRYFLEPLNDGSLPAYNIQRDIFNSLTRLPIGKEALLGSGLGKVVFFYTKSKKPEPNIKRMAEKLVGDWSRPILKRTDDYKKRHIETREFDHNAAQRDLRKAQSQFSLSQRPMQSASEAERERMLAPVTHSNRARVPDLPASYTVAPKSTFDGHGPSSYRPIGAGGIEAFRKMTQKPRRRG